MPAIYIGHGAPTLVDDPAWPAELAAWARDLPRPRSILMISAHWESQPLTVGATRPVPLVYDFYGFPECYYRTRYEAPGAPALAASVTKLIRDVEPVAQAADRGLDHGA
jgi:4,5-DOPA dioxygenase extradiol